LIFFLLRRRQRIKASELSADNQTRNEKDGATAVEKDGATMRPDIDGELDNSIRKPPAELASPLPYAELASPQLYAELPAGEQETLGHRPDAKTAYPDGMGNAI
jgi:hypothetical protein